MNVWKRWTNAPHTLLFRRALFQVHLWLGVGFGLYVLVICVTGSAFILSPLFQQWFVASTVADANGTALSGAALEERIAEVYRGFEVVDAMVASIPEQAVYVTLRLDGIETTRFFDHYSGEDLGSPYPWQIVAVDWLVDLHDDLLLGAEGRRLNGLGGGMFLLMALTGLVIWWQGSKRWHEGLLIRRGSTRSLLWQLHGFTGFWSLLLLLAWGLSGFYFAFPQTVVAIIDFIDPDLTDPESPDALLDLAIALHRARYDATWARLLWAALGLLPVMLFVTGFIVWWRRVIRRSQTGLS